MEPKPELSKVGTGTGKDNYGSTTLTDREAVCDLPVVSVLQPAEGTVVQQQLLQPFKTVEGESCTKDDPGILLQ